MAIKLHQQRPLRVFEDYLKTHGVELITPYWANRFYLEVMWDYPLPLRQATWNALKEIYPEPFQARPLPYPLLTRYLEEPYEAILAKIKQLPKAQQALHYLVLCCGLKPKQSFSVKESPRTKGGFVLAEPLAFGEKVRSIPITQEVLELVQAYPKRTLPGFKDVGKYHNALHEYLCRKGVPEVLRASIYGRWSAMKLELAEECKGLFKSRLF